MPIPNGVSASAVYNSPAFLQNAFQHQQLTPRRSRAIPSLLKLLLYLFCTFSTFYLTRYAFEKLRAVLDFVESQQLKSLRTEKKLQKLQAELEVAHDELKRLKEERRTANWDFKYTLLRDYISKADNEAAMKQLKKSISTDIKHVSSSLAKKQHKSREALQEDLRNMYDRLLQMQADQNHALQDILLRTTTSGTTLAPIDFAHLSDKGGLSRHYSVHRNKDEEGDLEKSRRRESTRPVPHFESEDDSSETSYSDGDDDDRIYSTNHDTTAPPGGKKYIQDLLSKDIEVEKADDFDDIFKQHMNDIQSLTPLSNSSLAQSIAIFPDNDIAEKDINSNLPHARKPNDVNEGNKNATLEGRKDESNEVLASRSSGGISHLPQGIDGEDDNNHQNEEGIVYESMNFISDEAVTQQLTQTFKESVMQDEKMKNSKLMSFFDSFAKNPKSLEESVHRSGDQEETRLIDKDGSVQIDIPDESENVVHAVEDTKNTWDMDEEAKQKLSELFAKKFQTDDEAMLDLPGDEEILKAENEFEVYKFDEDPLFNSRLQSCRESGEYRDLISRTGSEEEAMLKVKGNYFSFSVNPRFDLETYRRRKKQHSASIAKGQAEEISTSEANENDGNDTEMRETNSTTHPTRTPASTPNPSKQVDETRQASGKKKNSPRPKPWEKKKVAS